jgi:hypothetical protein
MIGKLRDPTAGDLLLSLSFIPAVERRKFGFSFLILIRIPVDVEPNPLTSPLDNRFLTLALSSTLTFSDIPLSVRRNCVGSEGIMGAGIDVRKEPDVICPEGWRVRGRGGRGFERNDEFEPEVDAEDDPEEPLKDGIGSMNIRCVPWFLGATIHIIKSNTDQGYKQCSHLRIGLAASFMSALSATELVCEPCHLTRSVSASRVCHWLDGSCEGDPGINS